MSPRDYIAMLFAQLEQEARQLAELRAQRAALERAIAETRREIRERLERAAAEIQVPPVIPPTFRTGR